MEPLLSQITMNRRIVAIPMIDIIDDNTFEYVPANKKLWGGFDWKLQFKWLVTREEVENVYLCNCI